MTAPYLHLEEGSSDCPTMPLIFLYVRVCIYNHHMEEEWPWTICPFISAQIWPATS